MRSRENGRKLTAIGPITGQDELPATGGVDVDPFASEIRGLQEAKPVHAALRGAGPLVEVPAPAGGSVWVVTDESLARDVLTDPRIS
jgi:hypothetical protein